MSNRRALRRDAAWLPGPGWGHRGPSREAAALMEAPVSQTMPPGCWHVSDHAAALLQTGMAVMRQVVHAASGEPFRLLMVNDQPVGIEPGSVAAAQPIVEHWGDPTAWIQGEEWRAVPAPTSEGSAT